jgi:peptidoglycan biosynthesis protein MviN/MurJ (putative lipid II flippase)
MAEAMLFDSRFSSFSAAGEASLFYGRLQHFAQPVKLFSVTVVPVVLPQRLKHRVPKNQKPPVFIGGFEKLRCG